MRESKFFEHISIFPRQMSHNYQKLFCRWWVLSYYFQGLLQIFVFRSSSFMIPFSLKVIIKPIPWESIHKSLSLLAAALKGKRKSISLQNSYFLTKIGMCDFSFVQLPHCDDSSFKTSNKYCSNNRTDVIFSNGFNFLFRNHFRFFWEIVWRFFAKKNTYWNFQDVIHQENGIINPIGQKLPSFVNWNNLWQIPIGRKPQTKIWKKIRNFTHFKFFFFMILIFFIFLLFSKIMFRKIV